MYYSCISWLWWLWNCLRVFLFMELLPARYSLYGNIWIDLLAQEISLGQQLLSYSTSLALAIVQFSVPAMFSLDSSLYSKNLFHTFKVVRSSSLSFFFFFYVSSIIDMLIHGNNKSNQVMINHYICESV